MGKKKIWTKRFIVLEFFVLFCFLLVLQYASLCRESTLFSCWLSVEVPDLHSHTRRAFPFQHSLGWEQLRPMVHALWPRNVNADWTSPVCVYACAHVCCISIWKSSTFKVRERGRNTGSTDNKCVVENLCSTLWKIKIWMTAANALKDLKGNSWNRSSPQIPIHRYTFTTYHITEQMVWSKSHRRKQLLLVWLWELCRPRITALTQWR